MNNLLIRTIKRFSFLIVLILSLIACSEDFQVESGKDSDDGVISIGTYPVGIAFHSAGSGIAKVVSENSNIKMIVSPYASTAAWMPELNRGEIEVGISSVPDMVWAFNGDADYESPHPNIRQLVQGNEIVTSGLTVRSDSGIDSISDLKGKRIASDFGGAEIMNRMFEIQLGSVGLTKEDIQSVPVADIGEGLEALKENRVDATFTGDPTVASFLEADNAVGIKALNYGDLDPKDIDSIPEEDIEKMQELIPGVKPIVYKGGFVEDETIIFSYDIGLIASKDLSEDGAYEVVKALFENYEELHPIFNWLETWTPDQMFIEEPYVPLHPGAVKYFKAEGLWTDELDALQEELLNQVE